MIYIIKYTSYVPAMSRIKYIGTCKSAAIFTFEHTYKNAAIDEDQKYELIAYPDGWDANAEKYSKEDNRNSKPIIIMSTDKIYNK